MECDAVPLRQIFADISNYRAASIFKVPHAGINENGHIMLFHNAKTIYTRLTRRHTPHVPKNRKQMRRVTGCVS